MATSRAQPALAAFVLHSYDFSESSLVVELFTRSLGRLVAVAKGAKRPTSNFRPVLLPFHRLALTLSRPSADPEAEVRTLRSAEWGGGRPLAPRLLMSGFYLNELLMKGLARQDPHPGLFDAYAETLDVLAAGEDEAAALRAFELTLLREMGVLPALDVETTSTDPVEPGVHYGLRAEAGLVRERDGIPGTACRLLHEAVTRADGAALRRAFAGEAAAWRAPLRHLVHYHLGTAQLRTRQVWHGLRRLADDSPRPAGEAPLKTR